ncbi:MAG: L-glutamate gamma-semialdehyde dehydrogenase [Bacteroidetes bacterium]|nr:MAG: L-glutamate gamma-semialdehyde dehydrogenase [Bacteroidota bacterium]TAG93272.1 MAG: L-glutamate gamma-semialdehyde dehydrogenase [Bacteroidota bacterium]
MNGNFKIPVAKNEPVLNYAPNSPERIALQKAVKEMKSQTIEIPMYIGGEKILTDKKIKISPPYEHAHTLGYFSEGDSTHVNQAIQAALNAKPQWENLSFENRASIFLKAADLVSGKYRPIINGATMLAQSKNAYQAEIDAACEFADFLRFNVQFANDIYSQQPESSPTIWNRLEYRALEGFVFAITPFNFTAIAGNLPAAPALMGNTVVWKPAYPQVYSAKVIMDIFEEAGLPAGVINLIFVDGAEAGDIIFKHKDFAGLHFTGSTAVFKHLWKEIALNLDKYKTYPRIVGETGGKDFVLVHKSAQVEEVVTGLIRGAFEFQGQKCSAASRAYIPSELWAEVKAGLEKYLAEIKTGTPEDFSNFVNAVIDEKAFDKIARYIDEAKNTAGNTLIAGGKYDKSKGYFIEPTIFEVKDPLTKIMVEEIFGPVLAIYIYQSENFDDVLDLVDNSSAYALTGAIFAQDRYALEYASKKLVNAAGNIYYNDKPTGAVVGQQPFGGARASGTNDKAGSYLNLLRWVSPRNIKDTQISPRNYKYPFLEV